VDAGCPGKPGGPQLFGGPARQMSAEYL